MARRIQDMYNVTAGARCCEQAHHITPGQEAYPMIVDGEDAARAILYRSHVGGGTPGCIVFETRTHLIIAIAGAREPADQAQTLEGYGNPTSVVGLEGRYNANAVAWAGSLAYFVGTTVAAKNKRVWIYGFSWGGAAAPMLCTIINNAAGRQIAECVTFGTPRFTDRIGARQMSAVLRLRLMRVSDPLPYIIPRPEEAPLLALSFPVASLRTWQDFVHCANGSILYANGDTEAGVLPPGVPLPIDVNLTDFIRLNMGEGRPHAITNYVRTLEARYVDSMPDSQALRGHSESAPIAMQLIEHREKPPSTPARRRILSNTVEANTMGHLNAERVAMKRDGRRKLYKRKVNGIWTVFHQSTAIYSASSKRDAIGVLNALRALKLQYDQEPFLWINTELLNIFGAS